MNETINKELIETIKDSVEELMYRESQLSYNDEGFETMQIIDYLVKKYIQINSARKED